MKDSEKKEDFKKEQSDSRSTISLVFDRASLRHALILVTFAIVLYWGLRHSEQPFAIIRRVFSITSPFVTGLCIAFVVNVLMRPLEKLWCRIWRKSKGKWPMKLKRPVSLVLSTLIVIGAVCALLFMILPEFITTIKSFIDSIPQYIKQIEGWWDSLTEFADRFGMVLPELSLNPDKVINFINSLLRNNDSLIFNKTLDITTSIFSGIVNFALAFAFSIYVLAQKEKLGRQVKKVLFAFFKEKNVNRFLELISLTNHTFSSFVTGQLTEAVIIGVLCFIGMLIFGMPYAPIISVLVGATALIPVFGAFIGTVVGAFLILLISPIKAIIFVVFILVLQQLEGNLIYPRVVGKSVGLPGIWVLAAVTVGNNLMGIVGMLFSVPLCALFYTLFRRLVASRIQKKKVSEQANDAIQSETAGNEEPQTEKQ